MSTNPSDIEGITYPWDDYPAQSSVREVADGILWISTPVPFVGLRQVNLWLVRDGNGWTQIDCGYGWEETRGLLEAVWKEALDGRPITRLIGTHFHPDHAGNMAWICERWSGLLPRMSLGEWFAAHLALHGKYSDNMEQRAKSYALHGLPAERTQLFLKEVIAYDAGVRLPGAFKRLREGEIVRIGADDWQVIVGEGHSPEHVSLYCAKRRILIAGDQILPQITTNVSTWPMEPDGDTLLGFLETCRRFMGVLHPDTLVLPSHRKPFHNVRARLTELARHHAARLNTVLDAIPGEAAAGDLLDVMFGNKLDGHQIGFAMGEAIAHLNHLVALGRLERVVRKDGGIRYRKVAGRDGPVPPHFV